MIEAFYIGLSGAIVTWMLNDFYKPGMIFAFWGNLLERNEQKWWAAPLGGCVFCHAIWVTAAMAALYVAFPIAWQLLTMFGICHIFICIFIKNEL